MVEEFLTNRGVSGGSAKALSAPGNAADLGLSGSSALEPDGSEPEQKCRQVPHVIAGKGLTRTRKREPRGCKRPSEGRFTRRPLRNQRRRLTWSETARALGKWSIKTLMRSVLSRLIGAAAACNQARSGRAPGFPRPLLGAKPMLTMTGNGPYLMLRMARRIRKSHVGYAFADTSMIESSSGSG